MGQGFLKPGSAPFLRLSSNPVALPPEAGDPPRIRGLLRVSGNMPGVPTSQVRRPRHNIEMILATRRASMPAADEEGNGQQGFLYLFTAAPSR